MLLVVTARPGFEAPWAHRPHASELALNRLRRTAAAELVRQIGRDLPDDMVRDILDQTDGVPLFIEELTRAVVEGGRDASAAPGIPTSLQASLMSRLDRLGPAKELAQLSAVIGRRFSWALLDAIAERSEAEVAAGLEQLIAAGLVFRKEPAPIAPIASSTRWCRAPRTKACCARRASSCMHGSPRSSKSVFPRRCPSRWPSTGRRRASQRAPPPSGRRRESRRSAAAPTARRSPC